MSQQLSGIGRTMDIIGDRLPHSIVLEDQLSFEQIYRQYWSKLYIFAFNVLLEREICEDILQEVFVSLWEKRHDVQISDLNSYLYQSVKYQIFNHFRNSRYRKQLLMKLDLMSTQYTSDEAYEKQELKAQIQHVISKLPEQRRIIFEMSRIQGLSNAEICENLSISPQTVKNQISESLKFIRKSLNSFYLMFF